jgi:hypothetical protein
MHAGTGACDRLYSLPASGSGSAGDLAAGTFVRVYENRLPVFHSREAVPGEQLADGTNAQAARWNVARPFRP